MREIKFRFWDGKVMQSDSDGWSDHIGINEMFKLLEGEYDNRVMQFTGLKDKNGVEIYEGDLVQCRASSGKVTAAVVYEPALGFGLRDFSSGLWQGQLGRKERPEVVGNIYEK